MLNFLLESCTNNPCELGSNRGAFLVAFYRNDFESIYLRDLVLKFRGDFRQDKVSFSCSNLGEFAG